MSRITFQVVCPYCGITRGYVRQVTAGRKPEQMILKCNEGVNQGCGGDFMIEIAVTVDVSRVFKLQEVKKS